MTVLENVISTIVKIIIKTLSDPEIKTQLFSLFQDQQVVPSKKNEEDNRFISNSYTDGWVW